MRYLSLLSICFLVSCGGFFEKQNAPEPSGKQVAALFLIHGKKGEVLLQPVVQLVLEDVDSSVSYVTKAGGKRRAGKVPLQQFLERYSPQFRLTTQPTAAYIFYDPINKGKYSDTPIRLSNPIYHQGNKTLTFDIYFLDEAAIINAGPINEVTLFIDDFVPAIKGWNK